MFSCSLGAPAKVRKTRGGEFLRNLETSSKSPKHTLCCLFALLLVGCNGASSRVDVGPNYTAPAPAGLLTVDGVTYQRPATPEREEKILSGYPQIKLGQTREEVRALLGAPDFHVAAHRRGSDR